MMVFILLCGKTNAQNTDSVTFSGKYHNNEYNIYLEVNLKEKNILVAGQEILGELDGYFGSTKTSHIWAITSSEINGNTATIDVVNNYGSEDFTACLVFKDEKTIEFKHLKGSTFKFPVDKKWQKLPTKMIFEKNEIY